MSSAIIGKLQSDGKIPTVLYVRNSKVENPVRMLVNTERSY